MTEHEHQCKCGEEHKITMNDVVANLEINLVTLIELMIEKNLITEQEFIEKMNSLFKKKE